MSILHRNTLLKRFLYFFLTVLEIPVLKPTHWTKSHCKIIPKVQTSRLLVPWPIFDRIYKTVQRILFLFSVCCYKMKTKIQQHTILPYSPVYIIIYIFTISKQLVLVVTCFFYYFPITSQNLISFWHSFCIHFTYISICEQQKDSESACQIAWGLHALIKSQTVTVLKL